tara:strand:+ start:197 stop:853 length:657 start_codon:yes stop_codon:yes gene_type:complete
MAQGNPHMPVYNSVQSRGRLAPLGGAAGALTPPKESSLGDGALGGFFDHLLAGNKKPTTQQKIDGLLIARDEAIGRSREEHNRNQYLKSRQPKVERQEYIDYRNKGMNTPPHLRSGGAEPIPTRYAPNWDQNSGVLSGKHPNAFKEGNPLDVELMYIDAELKRLTGKSGYSNNGQSFQPKRQYVDHPDSIFYRDDLSKKDADVGGFMQSIMSGITGAK